ncbi:MAG: TlpA disulfide reductase family protein [Longimicrobiales bacterium]|nr:TlpA disulfide reductase family protein [Longimicrobiales bacterium]
MTAACEPRIEWEGSLAVGDPAPEYTIQDLEGNPASLGDFRGQPVLLNFWATWCTPCRTETPFLQSIHERYNTRGLQVVGVSLDSPGSVDEIRDFMEEFDVGYRILYDPRQVGMDRFSLIGLPVTYVLDPEARIRFVRVGPVSEDDEEFMETLEDVTS